MIWQNKTIDWNPNQCFTESQDIGELKSLDKGWYYKGPGGNPIK